MIRYVQCYRCNFIRKHRGWLRSKDHAVVIHGLVERNLKSQHELRYSVPVFQGPAATLYVVCASCVLVNALQRVSLNLTIDQ